MTQTDFKPPQVGYFGMTFRYNEVCMSQTDPVDSLRSMIWLKFVICDL